MELPAVEFTKEEMKDIMYKIIEDVMKEGNMTVSVSFYSFGPVINVCPLTEEEDE